MENSTVVGYLNAEIKNNLFVTLGILSEGGQNVVYEYNKRIFEFSENNFPPDKLQEKVRGFIENEISNYVNMVVFANRAKLPLRKAIIEYRLEFEKDSDCSTYTYVNLQMKPII